YAIELAVRAGARVIATASGPEKAELARTAGAAHVVNYRDADAADQIRAAAGQTDRIIELALGANLALDLAVARPGAVIVDYAAEPADPVLPVRACMTANLTLRFVLLYGVPRAALRRAAEGITAALADGALTELPVHRFGLSDIVAAHEAAEAGPLGKVLVAPPALAPEEPGPAGRPGGPLTPGRRPGASIHRDVVPLRHHEQRPAGPEPGAGTGGHGERGHHEADPHVRLAPWTDLARGEPAGTPRQVPALAARPGGRLPGPRRVSGR